MSDLLKIIKERVSKNEETETTPASPSPELISEIFAPGENIYFTQKRENLKSTTRLVPSNLHGSQNLIDVFQFDEKTNSKITCIQALVREHFIKHSFSEEQILKTKSISALHINTDTGHTKKMIYHDLATSVSKNNEIKNSLIVFTNTSYLQIPEGRIYLMDIIKNEVIDQIKYELEACFFLNENEYKILSATILGYSNKEISEQLNLSENTVQKYRKNIIKKTNSSNLFEVIKKYHSNLIKPDF